MPLTPKPRATPADARVIAARLEAAFATPARPAGASSPESGPVRPPDDPNPARGSSATSGRPAGAPTARPADRVQRVP